MPTDAHPRIKILNWQVGYREGSSTSKVSQAIAATSHVDRLVEDASTAYMAPEAIADENTSASTSTFSRWGRSPTTSSPASRPRQRSRAEQQAA